MIKSTSFFCFLGLTLISAMTAYPCQAQTTAESRNDATEINEIASPQSPDVANTSVSDRPKNRNISKSFTVSEFNSILPKSSARTTTTPTQSPRINPLGCRFFDVPSMRQ
ncbi:hypothetical protein QT972_08125 [Microcoleus sp. herbarium7]|uniref:hypothetical protein n=1 Tax=Microcoleus sp. herbarium7 TaxID=3055435 RepID=UPI002FD1B108